MGFYLDGLKIQEINKLPVVDYSCSDDLIEYVLVERNDKNKIRLRKLGMGRDYAHFISEAGIDVAPFAERLGANWFDEDNGFSIRR